MKTHFYLGLRRTIVITALFISSHIIAQDIKVPGNDNKELSNATTVTIDAIPELSYSDHPAVWNQGWGPHCPAPNSCARKAKRFIKKEKFIDGLGYAARVLELNPRKRAERKALEVLTTENYSRALKEFEQDLKAHPEIPEYQNWQSSKAMYDRMWYAGRFNIVNAKLQQLHHPKVNIKVNPVDADMLGNLATKLSTYRTYAANDYYTGGHYYLKRGNAQGDKEHYKRSALSFLIANEYVTDFKDAKSQYESAKKLATSTVYFSGHYHGHGGFGGTLDEDVKAEILRMSGFSRLPFVEIVNSKSADYHVKLVTNGLELVTRGKTSDKQEYSREEPDTNGKAITKKATITTYSSGYNARAKVNVEVIERKTNKVVYSMISENTYQWITVWQKGSGDTDIVKGKYKRYLGKSADKAPVRKTLYERAIALCAKDIARKVYINFIRKIGASPRN
ncbi:hypothetical protein ATE84_2890 [Aquimarina sp. MAR_2010_214]|uniref:hypothetical protein n=1 Tax=Aquimarina sp. MAR_2010_214 TaxID=1250026 RepID=UPI000C71029C|nr:hypothetical protein [Aquimarina sp. MAR_2010_214]PKV50823.1 hypothetical protein ATE84_2890 [Aquimarina sp. MAR_2010_214]